MTRPPVVSRALLTKQNAPVVVANPDWDGVMRAKAREPKPSRHPIGVVPNALPELWIARQADSSLWLMAESSEGVTCLATISAETLTKLRASRAPVELKP